MVHVFGVRRTQMWRDTVETCLSCMYAKVESMPVSDNEIYTFRYDMI
jgi:hypothetical protein